MPNGDRHLLEFGPFRLDPSERLLFRAGQPVSVTAKAFDVLHLLVRNAGRTVTKEEFMTAVWPDAVVEEANLTDNISTLRQALGDDAREPRYIQTVPRRGYRFLADVREASLTAPPAAEPEAAARRRMSRGAWAAVAAVALVAAGAAAWLGQSRAPVAQPAAVTSVAAEVRSLAVLPFEPLVAGQRDAPLELGMTDALIAKLSRLRRIRVRPTSAVLPLAGQSLPVHELAAKLDVDVLLEGKVQKAAGRVRVSVQLVRAADGSTIWAGHFDEPMLDIFDVQDAISQRVAHALALRLSEPERASLSQRATTSVDAYEHYVLGRYFWNKRTAADFERAIQSFQRAVAADPSYALPHAALAQTYVLLPNWTGAPADEMYALAEREARRALELDPQLADAYVARAAAKNSLRRERAAAGDDYRRAIELNPGDATARQWYGEWLVAAGRVAEGRRELELARELDPLSPIIAFALGVSLYIEGRADDAEREFRSALELDRTMLRPHVFLSRLAFDRGRLEEAARERAIVLTSHTGETMGSETEAKQLETSLVAAARAGREAYLRRQLEIVNALNYPSASALRLELCALLDDRECAFNALEWVERTHHPIGDNVKVDPYFVRLREDPRFPEALRRMGFTP